MRRPSFLTLTSLVGVMILILWGLSSLSYGAKPKPADIAPDQFSARRAFGELTDLIANNKPHPSGSAENLRIRKTIERKFLAMGYTPQIQRALACTLHYPGCTRVENIIVRVRGTGSGDAILLTAHYDSVPAGPAAADDGVGTVTILEIARNLKAMPAFKNDFIFLITDGEEGGLRGARAFADENPLMDSVKLVVNLEARGASGPGTMFETSANNQNLIQSFAKTNPHPVANSLSYEIYKRLPNDTDYSIYKAEGIAGLNFAFTGDVALYHSRLDDLAHLDKSSLQDQGDNMLSAVLAFGNLDLNRLKTTQDATYIDVFGKTLLHWPSWANLPLALLCLVVLILIGFRGKLCPIKVLKALGVSLLAGAGVIGLGYLLSFPLGRWPDLFYLDHPHPWPGRLAMIFAAGFASWGFVRVFGKGLSLNGQIWSAGLIFALCSIISAVLMGGASYIFLLPALAISVGLAFDLLFKNKNWWLAAWFGFVVMCYMAFYHFIALEIILPYRQAHLRIAPLVFLAFGLLPFFIAAQSAGLKRGLGWAMGALALGCALVSWQLPGFDAAHPRAQNFIYAEGYDGDKAVWISEVVDRQDETFLQKSGFGIQDRPKALWKMVGRHIAMKQAAKTGYAPPMVDIVDDVSTAQGRTLVFDIASAQNGFEMALAFDPQNPPIKVWINDKLAADYSAKPYRRALTIRGPGAHTYRVKIEAKPGPFAMAVVDSFTPTKAQLGVLAALRPANAAPLHSGDRVLVYKPISLP